ncbi:HXXEE domain-containing protein [Bacillus aerolatus]|uniref:HXXEE domain-containing protein n=1 Tax=Bacillus aerolatus TaxID=2653354 RepID=A0A6I1FK87_9BACI|nr:HXXEE domain-containing protein [Bacillus aerolatus]KAB7709085.1 HXXEE domain-containing protein [Bacillus aerolatus]
MFAQVKRLLPLRAVLWLFPLVFLIHDMEELVLIESWMENHRGMLAEKLHLGGWNLQGVLWTTPRFAIAVTVLLGLICIASYCAARPGATAKDRKWFVIGITALFLNVFTHLAQTALFHSYTPGVVTAIAVVLPYTLYTYGRLLQKGWVSRVFVRSMLLVAGVILAAGIIGSTVL